MPSSYPGGLDPIPLPDWDGALGQPARTAESFLTDVVDSIKAIQAGVGTTGSPGPLVGGVGGDVVTLVADTTGTVNASPAVQAWLDGVIAGNGIGYAPPGDYLLNTPITASGLSDAKFSLTGAGVGVTRFIVPASNTTGAFILDATGTPRDAEVFVRDFSIITRGVGQGTGFSFVMTEGGNMHNRSVTMENVRVYGEDIDTDVFDVGIDLTGNWRPLLFNVIVGGPFGPGPAGDYTDTSPQFVATCALVVDGSYGWEVVNCYLWAAHTLISDIGTAAEGGRIISSQLVACRIALNRYRTGRQPGFQVHDVHFNYRDTGLLIDGGKIVFVRGCHPYNFDTDNEYSLTSRDIWLKNCERVVITDNVFHYDGSPDRINVHVDATTYAAYVTIANNLFASNAAYGVYIGAGSTNVVLTGNQYPGTYTKNVTDFSQSASLLAPVTDGWKLEHQGAGATVGPDLQLMRDSTSPAASDIIGGLSFMGRDSTGVATTFASLRGVIVDPTNTSEDGALAVWGQTAGALTKLLQLQDVGTVGDSTAMFLLVKRGGVTALERVLLGAADSGGSGYRTLIVPNS